VKQQIMLHGGVLTSMAKLPSFEAYTASAGNPVYNEDVKATDKPEWHAVYCYGWEDDVNDMGGGWWQCKNR
jgi:hypothetical protein